MAGEPPRAGVVVSRHSSAASGDSSEPVGGRVRQQFQKRRDRSADVKPAGRNRATSDGNRTTADGKKATDGKLAGKKKAVVTSRARQHEPTAKEELVSTETESPPKKEPLVREIAPPRELSAIKERASPAVTSGGETARPSSGDVTEGSSRDSGNHSLTGDDAVDSVNAADAEEVLEASTGKLVDREHRESLPEGLPDDLTDDLPDGLTNDLPDGLTADLPDGPPGGLADSFSEGLPDSGSTEVVPTEPVSEGAGWQVEPAGGSRAADEITSDARVTSQISTDGQVTSGSMSGDMEVLRAVDELPTDDQSVAHGETQARIVSLDRVLIDKYEGGLEEHTGAGTYKRQTKEPLSNAHASELHAHEQELKNELYQLDLKLNDMETPNESHHQVPTQNIDGAVHAKTRREGGVAQNARETLQTGQSSTSRTESRTVKKRDGTKSLKNPTKIPRRKPRAASQEDFRADLKDGGGGTVPLQPPTETGFLQKSSSLVTIPRSSSAMMGDLHVYLVPREKWSSPRRLAERASRNDTISLGFVRAHPDSTLNLLRREISAQLLGNELALRHYKFVRPVGKHFTQVKAKQESHLKARNFMPPYTSDPEIHLLRLLPHDPLDEVEDVVYWRGWNRAYRLDRDYPIIRNTSAADQRRAPHDRHDGRYTRKHRRHPSPARRVPDDVHLPHAIDSGSYLAGRPDRAGRRRAESEPERASNGDHRVHYAGYPTHHDDDWARYDDYWARYDDYWARHSGYQSRYGDYEAHYDDCRIDYDDCRIDYDDYDSHGVDSSPEEYGGGGSDRWRGRAPPTRSASSTEISPRLSQPPRRASDPSSRTSRHSGSVSAEGSRRAARRASDPPSDTSRHSPVLFIDNGRLIDSDLPQIVAPPVDIHANSTSGRTPAPRRILQEYARLERPKRPTTLHHRRRRSSVAVRPSPRARSRIHLAQRSVRESAPAGRPPARRPRQTTSDVITDVLVIEHPADVESTAGNPGQPITVTDAAAYVTEAGGGGGGASGGATPGEAATPAASANPAGAPYIPHRRQQQYAHRDQISQLLLDHSDGDDDPYSTEYREMYRKKDGRRADRLVQPDAEMYDRDVFEKDTSYQTQYVTHPDDDYRAKANLRPDSSTAMPHGEFDDSGHGSRRPSERSDPDLAAPVTGGERPASASPSRPESVSQPVAAGGSDGGDGRHASDAEGSSSKNEKKQEPNVSSSDEVKSRDANVNVSKEAEGNMQLSGNGHSTARDEEHLKTMKEKENDRGRKKSKKKYKSKNRDKSKNSDKSKKRDTSENRGGSRNREKSKDRVQSKNDDDSRHKLRSKSRNKHKSRERSKSRRTEEKDTPDGKDKKRKSNRHRKDDKTDDDSKSKDDSRSSKEHPIEDELLNLRKKLTAVKRRRADNERRRDELVMLSRSLQEQLSIKRDEDVQKWRDLYLQERKLTGPLEESCSALRRDIDKMHKKLLQRVETRHKGTGKEGPSRKLTMKINCKRMDSDIEDWKRRVGSTQLILDTEIKLRRVAERDVKELRQELSQKRVTVTQARSQYGLDAVDWYLLMGRQKAAQRDRSSRSPSRQISQRDPALLPA